MNRPNDSSKHRREASVSRRNFLKTTSTAAVGGSVLGALPAGGVFAAAADDELKVALVGCGGRGSGAAGQALATYSQGPVKLVAMADAFEDRLSGSFRNLKQRHPDRVSVDEDTMFVGFDAYKKAIALSDVVILATPPGFRPMHFEEAVMQGKHVFMEKPVATDAPGVRQVLAAAKIAKDKNLKVGVGLQRHHHAGYQETIKRLQDGAIGDIVATRAYWNGNTPWVRRRADLEEDYGRKLTEMEYQMCNWYYFNWICGDHITEQHIHNLDVINWLMGDYPVKANGMGGAEVRVGIDYGEIFDHHCVEFTYANGAKMFSQCRHQLGCWNSVSEHAHGSNGAAQINRQIITGPNAWRFEGKAKNPYQQEHDVLFHAIRHNEPHNEAEYGAKSSMTAVLGRTATYSGKEIEWDKLLASEVSLLPEILAWDAPMKSMPGEDGLYPHPVPGQPLMV